MSALMTSWPVTRARCRRRSGGGVDLAKAPRRAHRVLAPTEVVDHVIAGREIRHPVVPLGVGQDAYGDLGRSIAGLDEGAAEGGAVRAGDRAGDGGGVRERRGEGDEGDGDEADNSERGR